MVYECDGETNNHMQTRKLRTLETKNELDQNIEELEKVNISSQEDILDILISGFFLSLTHRKGTSSNCR
jgi:hypothetical protein